MHLFGCTLAAISNGSHSALNNYIVFFFRLIILAFSLARLWRQTILSSSCLPSRRVGSVAAPSSPLPPDSKNTQNKRKQITSQHNNQAKNMHRNTTSKTHQGKYKKKKKEDARSPRVYSARSTAPPPPCPPPPLPPPRPCYPSSPPPGEPLVHRRYSARSRPPPGCTSRPPGSRRHATSASPSWLPL